MITGKLGVGIG